ncbi:unnamed protein product [Rotaria sordida]|uniref:F-box domain-containing protein n=1 Tax=Rotaria sordida TaxID=392033 RepID=A0A815SQA8_9BILA|nr:unnamed protein product [Rotaria sordida]CAF3857984.1 unnamed protein product [Rotaria sordida]
MITRLETLPNEILLRIFSHLSWFDMLTSLWSLNIRFNFLICSTFSINNCLLNRAIIFTEQRLSYNKSCSILFSLIFKSLYLCSSIKRIHFDGTNSMACDLSYEWLFNDKNMLRFPNLKSLILTRCGLIESLVQTLFNLIKHQLDELVLTFDESVFHRMNYVKDHMPIFPDRGN